MASAFFPIFVVGFVVELCSILAFDPFFFRESSCSVVLLYLRGRPFLRGSACSVVSRSPLRPWTRVGSCSVDADVTSVVGLEPACLRLRKQRASKAKSTIAKSSQSTQSAQTSGTIFAIEFDKNPGSTLAISTSRG